MMLQERPLAIVVDHNLSAKGSREAEWTATQLDGMGLEPSLLRLHWDNEMKGVGSFVKLMSLCRTRRNRLVHKECSDSNIHTLLLGDSGINAATLFLFRLAHASGIEGLVGAPRHEWISGHDGAHSLQVMRPLLDFSPRFLEDACTEEGLLYIENPESYGCVQRKAIGSILNNDLGNHKDGTSGGIIEDICRVKNLLHDVVRSQEKIVDQLLLDSTYRIFIPPRISRLSNNNDSAKSIYLDRFASAKMDINWAHKRGRLDRMLESMTNVPYCVLKADAFAIYDRYVSAMALSKILQTVSSKNWPPTLQDCLKLHEMLVDGRLKRSKFTGGGCLVQSVSKTKGKYILITPQKRGNMALQDVHDPASKMLRVANM